MKVLWVFAHPERASLSGALFAEGTGALRDSGHLVETSDLYAMKWKAAVDADDYETPDAENPADGRLVVTRASRRAYEGGLLSPDVRAEHAKLEWADVIVVQFPLWWYSVPAILKGWFDRVFVKGFAYGVGDPAHPGRSLRYGDGALAGKRVLTVVTIGSPEKALGPRGINGQLDQLLFPLLHGTLWYAGLTVLDPVCVFGADKLSDSGFQSATELLRSRLANIMTAEPIPYRYQNRGDYDDDLVLLPDHAPGRTGLGVHIDQS